MDFAILGAAVVGGYVAAIFTWDKLHTFFIGAQAKAQALRMKALALENSVKSVVK